MKEKILNLRKDGFSYREIAKILGCSTSTISYHCGKGQKEKSRNRKRKHNSTVNGIIGKKISLFQTRELYKKQRDFKRRKDSGRNALSRRQGQEFTFDELRIKIGNNPKCYLTGRYIDLFDTRGYNLDHIVPPRIKIDNTIDNCQIACKEANMAKSDMMLDEFINLCVEVCVNFGYIVKKAEDTGTAPDTN